MAQELFKTEAVKSSLDMWKSGVPLTDALDVFGSIQTLSSIRRAARSAATANTEIGKANFRKAGKDADAMLDALGSVHASLIEAGRVRAAKEARLLERIRSGELMAWGFPIHDRNTVDPEQVPMFMLDTDFAKWRSRSFAGHDRHYADVTVCKAAGVSQAAKIVIKKPAHKRGPKPIGSLVADAVDQLRSVDPNFDNCSQEKQIIAIQAEVARQNPGRYPGKSQPGHTTVWNYLTGRKPMR